MSLVSIALPDLTLQSPRSRLSAAALPILETWDTNPLSPLAERTLRMIASQYTRKGFCHATHEQLASSLGMVKSTLQRGVDELEADGYLVITRRPRTSNLTFLADGVKEALRVQKLERVREAKKRAKSRLLASKRRKNRPKAEPTAQPQSRPRKATLSIKSKAANTQQHHRGEDDVLACFNEKQRETTKQLIVIGVTPSQAILIVRKYAIERIEKHLQAQRYLTAKNPAGYLVTAIRNDYQELLFTEEYAGEDRSGTDAAQASSQAHCLTKSENCKVTVPTRTEKRSNDDAAQVSSQVQCLTEIWDVLEPADAEECSETDTMQASSRAECLTESESWDGIEPVSVEECSEPDTAQAASQAEPFAESEAGGVIQVSPTVSPDAINRAAVASSSTRNQWSPPLVAGLVPLGLSLAALNASFLVDGQRSNAGAAQAHREAEWALTEAERREIAQELSGVVPDAIDRALTPSTRNQASTPVVAELVALGVQPAIAALTASTYSEERIRRQLKLGKHLTAKNPAAFIVTAIRRDYAIDQPVPGSEHEVVFHREQQERLAQKRASASSNVPKKKPSDVPPPSPLDLLRAKFNALGEQEHAKFLAAAREDLIKSPPSYIAHLVARRDFENPLLAGTVRTRAMKMWESSA